MLSARDGVRLAATLFEPQTPNGAAILVNSGTGIPRQFYGAFANHLALRGFAVLTYDYRAVGGSEAPSAAPKRRLRRPSSSGAPSIRPR
jgi:predicted alpha/beta hydrolase